MNIEITKNDCCYIADCTNFPGSPPIGIGSTKLDALACLFYRTINGEYDWKKHIKNDEPLIINGKVWKQYQEKISKKIFNIKK